MPGKKKRPRGKGLSAFEKVLVAALLVVAIWGAYSVLQPSPPSTETTTGNVAPDFTLPEIDRNGLTGRQVSLSSFRGKVVLLEFMEPWCGHCQKMMPALESLHNQFGPQNVVFLSVAGPWNDPSTGRPTSAEDVAKFIGDYQSNLIYVYDGSGTVFSTYGVKGTPTFFILGKDGSIGPRYEGEVSPETLAADISRQNV